MADRFVSLMSLLSDDVSVRWIVTLLHFFWQGALVGGIVAIAGRLLRGASAQSQYALFSVALLLLPVCVAVTFYVVDVPAGLQSSSRLESSADIPVKSSATSWQASEIPSAVQIETTKAANTLAPSKHVVTNAATTRTIVDANLESPSHSSLADSALAMLSGAAGWIAVVYIIGVVCFLLRLLSALWGGHRLRARTVHVTDAKLLKLIADQADRVKLKHIPIVAYCERVAVPIVLGLLRPMILLPVPLMTGLNPDDFAAIIRHELAHIRRYDLWMNLLQRVIESLLFFHPAVWFISRRLSAEREVCCDDLVVSSGYEPLHYAGALLRMAELCAKSRQPGAMALAATGNRTTPLERRIERLINWGKTPRLQLTRSGMAGLLITLFTLILAPGIAHTWAEVEAQETAPGAPKQTPEPSATKKNGAQLPPGTEGKLQWGEPVNGLRAALVRPPMLGQPLSDEVLDFDLVVQNVSNDPIRLSANSKAPNPRRLVIRKNDVILTVLMSKHPTLADFTLQPREVAILRMFTGNIGKGTSIAEDPDLTFSAEMSIEQAPAGAWTGKLVTVETSGAEAAGKPLPKDKNAQALFKKWQESARINGKIPGGALRSLAAAAANFVKLNPTDKRAPKLAELLKRIDTSRDWTQADAVALLDEVTAIYANLPKWAGDLPRFSISESIRKGQPLPAELTNAPWGETQPNGLRAAWLLDPRAKQHRLGTPLKSRILFHNAGEKNGVVFRVLTWNQSSSHKARDANGTEIKITSTNWTTIPQVVACRLAPGEFTEVIGAGIGVGANKDSEDWRGTRVGAWIEAQEGDDVTFTPAPVSVNGNDGRAQPIGGPPWWLGFITNRLKRDAPLPADAAERKRLLDRAMRDIFGIAPTPEEITTFVADRGPDAMDALANRLARRTGISPFTGTLQSADTIFRVLPVDPDAAKKPRVATGPGRYTLGDQVRLVIVRKPIGKRRVNEANIVFFSANPQAGKPGKPHEIKLPDGYQTWAIAWKRGSTMLWLAEQGVLQSYDFTNPANVKVTRIEAAAFSIVPKPLRDALGPALEGGDVSKETTRKPAATSRNNDQDSPVSLLVDQPKTTKSESTIRGSNYLVLPWKKTELQMWLIGSAGDPKENCKAYVLIDGHSFYTEDGKLSLKTLDWKQLAKQLKPFSDRKNGVVVFSVLGLPDGDIALKLGRWTLQGFGEQSAGFFRAYVSHRSGREIFWDTIAASQKKMKGRTEGLELPVGNELVQVYPVQTFLSSLKSGNSDCVVRIIPRLSKDSDKSLPPEIRQAIIEYVPRVKVHQKGKLYFELTCTKEGKGTARWFLFEEGAKELARSLSYEDATGSLAEY